MPQVRIQIGILESVLWMRLKNYPIESLSLDITDYLIKPCPVYEHILWQTCLILRFKNNVESILKTGFKKQESIIYLTTKRKTKSLKFCE